AQVVDAALVQPLIGFDDELFAERVLTDVSQLVLILDAGAEAMMEGVTLPAPWLLHMPATEPTFPKLDPLVYAEMQITRSTKEVNVIRHEEVIADQPGGCFCAPDLRQGVLDGDVRHPRHCILGIDRYEENVRLAQENVRASRRRLAADIAVDAFALRH